MKFLYLIVLLSSLLFSMDKDKQIILGSYSVEKNGLNAVLTTKKQIKNDENLQALMKKYSLRAMDTVISGYTVVSVNHFTSYADLLVSLKAFKAYYDDAYVLTYPTKGISDVQSLEDIELKAKEEQLLAQELEDKRLQEQKVQEQKLEEQRMAEENARLAAENTAREKLAKEVAEEKVTEEKSSVEAVESVNNMASSEIEDEDVNMQIYYLLGALALLILMIGGFFLYNKNIAKDDKDN